MRVDVKLSNSKELEEYEDIKNIMLDERYLTLKTENGKWVLPIANVQRYFLFNEDKKSKYGELKMRVDVKLSNSKELEEYEDIKNIMLDERSLILETENGKWVLPTVNVQRYFLFNEDKKNKDKEVPFNTPEGVNNEVMKDISTKVLNEMKDEHAQEQQLQPQPLFIPKEQMDPSLPDEAVESEE